jgi:hypothetical protein
MLLELIYEDLFVRFLDLYVEASDILNLLGESSFIDYCLVSSAINIITNFCLNKYNLN